MTPKEKYSMKEIIIVLIIGVIMGVALMFALTSINKHCFSQSNRISQYENGLWEVKSVSIFTYEDEARDYYENARFCKW